jgi:hypothetical protein
MRSVRLSLFCLALCGFFMPPVSHGQAARWWKGNLHTHSFWSDGDEFPEMIATWYKTNGYHFLALSDHNVLLAGEKWVTTTNAERKEAVARYIETFGRRWVTERRSVNGRQVRLKTLEEFRPRLEEPQRFLLVPSEEISADYQKLPIHINASNVRELVKPPKGTNVYDVIQQTLDIVRAQRQRTGQPIIAHINHPNFGWALTAEDIMRVRGEHFFEVYNGHPSVQNEGDDDRASVERVWDIALAFRLSRLGLGPMYGLAVDDSHNYHTYSTNKSNPGRGWIMVQADNLDARSLIAAMENGDFYASTGVVLLDVQRSARGLHLKILPEPGVTYVTTFIGTLRGFNPMRTPGRVPAKGNPVVTGIYSDEIGAVLGRTEGVTASYEFAGDELYVRAKVTSSRVKTNSYRRDELEAAWVQPAILQSNLLWAALQPVPKAKEK